MICIKHLYIFFCHLSPFTGFLFYNLPDVCGTQALESAAPGRQQLTRAGWGLQGPENHQRDAVGVQLRSCLTCELPARGAVQIHEHTNRETPFVTGLARS